MEHKWTNTTIRLDGDRYRLDVQPYGPIWTESLALAELIAVRLNAYSPIEVF